MPADPTPIVLDGVRYQVTWRYEANVPEGEPGGLELVLEIDQVEPPPAGRDTERAIERELERLALDELDAEAAR